MSQHLVKYQTTFAALKARLNFSFPIPVSYICWGVILIITIPFTSYSPKFGIDPSWIHFINKYNYFLINNPYKFGTDVIFTYGPLGFILYPDNGQPTYFIALFIHFIYGTLCAVLLTRLARQEHFKSYTLLIFLLSSLVLFTNNLNVILLAFFLLVVGLIKEPFSHFYYLIIALFTSCLMFYIKFNVGVLFTAILCSVYLLLVLTRQWKISSKFTMAFLFFYLIVLPAIYLIYSPSLTGLFQLFYYSIEISRGYSAAMGNKGEKVLLYLALLFILLYFISLLYFYKEKEEAYKASIIFIPGLFLTFKGTFVRQDMYHYADFFNFYLISVSILYLMPHKAKTLITSRGSLILISLLVGILFYPASLLAYCNNSITSTVNRLFSGTQEVVERNLGIANDLVIGEVDANIKKIIGNEAVVIVPHNLLYADLYNLQLSPLPILQNYAAFTDKLDSLDADFIEKPERNQFILFEFAAIDERNPFIETPLLWQSINRWYDVRYQTDKILLLERRSEARISTLVKIETVYPTKNQEIHIPEKDNQVIAKVSMNYNLAGDLSLMFYRIPTIRMNLYRENGKEINARIIPSTLRNGIFINYFPSDLKEAYQLFKTGRIDQKTSYIQFTGDGCDFIRSPLQIDFYELVK